MNDTTLAYTYDITYDANGNRQEITKTPVGQGGTRHQYNFWDENDMLYGQLNENGLFQYVYDAMGQRLMKGGLLKNTFAYNGNQSSTEIILPFTVYVSPFLVYEGKNSSGEWQYSKHFYAGGERVASKIGSKYSDPTLNTSGDREWINETDFPYGQKAILVELEGMIQSMDLGDPLMKAIYRSYAPPFDTINECLEGYSLDDYEEERCICMWFPDQADSTLNCNTERTFWYHADYIGHTEFITDVAGRPYQYFAYMPFGEQYVEQHAANGFYSSPFRFNGKEYDEYTGQYYYGARFHDPLLGLWLSPDPMFEVTPYLTPYHFVEDNPINLIDPNGLLAVSSTKTPEIKREKCPDINPKSGDSGNIWQDIGAIFNRIGQWFDKQMTGKGKKSEQIEYQYTSDASRSYDIGRNDGRPIDIEIDIPKINSHETATISYDMYTYEDELKVLNGNKEFFSTPGAVSGRGSTGAIPARFRSLRIMVTPSIADPNNTSWYDIRLVISSGAALYRKTTRRVFFGLFKKVKVERIQTGLDATDIYYENINKDNWSIGETFQLKWIELNPVKARRR